jgi:hypothetical protein
MRQLLKILILSSFVCFLCASTAGAGTVSFGDTANYWPGWNNTKNGTGDDSQDTIGEPDFTGGTATFSSTGKLTGLSFTVSNPVAPSSWNANISPGDLFIDVNSDQNWDYVVHLTGISGWQAGHLSTVVGQGSYSIYAVNIPLGSTSAYVLSGTDNSGLWSGFLIRDGHPVTLSNGSLPTSSYGTVDFSGWGTDPSFDFSKLPNGGLTFSNLTIGWTVNCANDVLYEHIKPVPEPATMLLLGTGLIGLAGYRARRRAKN